MVKVKAEIKPVQQILQNHGLGEGGPVQKLVDSEMTANIHFIFRSQFYCFLHIFHRSVFVSFK